MTHTGAIMVSSGQQAVAKRNLGIQTEIMYAHAAVQFLGYRECLAMSLLQEGSRDIT